MRKGFLLSQRDFASLDTFRWGINGIKCCGIKVFKTVGLHTARHSLWEIWKVSKCGELPTKPHTRDLRGCTIFWCHFPDTFQVLCLDSPGNSSRKRTNSCECAVKINWLNFHKTARRSREEWTIGVMNERQSRNFLQVIQLCYQGCHFHQEQCKLHSRWCPQILKTHITISLFVWCDLMNQCQLKDLKIKQNLHHYDQLQLGTLMTWLIFLLLFCSCSCNSKQVKQLWLFAAGVMHLDHFRSHRQLISARHSMTKLILQYPKTSSSTVLS
jgi:hypothetical protein